MVASLAEAVCRLNVLLDLDNLSTRRVRKRRRTGKAEFLVLARLVHGPKAGLSPNDLAEYLQMVPSHVHKTTRKLATQSFVKRSKSPTREGGIVVSITANGRQHLETCIKGGVREFAIFDVIWKSEKDRADALRLLRDVLSRLEQLASVG